MRELLKFERKKISMQRVMVKQLLFVLVYVIAMLIVIKNNIFNINQTEAFRQSYYVYIFINVFMIFFSAKLIYDDFNAGSYKLLLSMGFERKKIFLTKLVALFLVFLCLGACISTITIISGFVLDIEMNITLVKDILSFAVFNVISMGALILLSSLIVLYTKKEKYGIGLCLFLYILSAIGGGLHLTLLAKFSYIKYSLINAMYLSSQYVNGTLNRYTNMTTLELVVLNLAYISIIFCAYLFTSRKAIS